VKKAKSAAHGGPAAPMRFPVSPAACCRALFGRAGPPPEGRFAGSGQEALTLALRGAAALAGAEPDAPVVVPDFICPTVPAAVRDAGLRPQVVPLDATAWFYELDGLEEALRGGTRLAVLVSYFGLSPLPPGPARGRARALLAEVDAVEDSAQAFGTEAPPWLPRSRFRIFSFGRGKSLPLVWGGLAQGLEGEAQAWLDAQPMHRGPGAVLASLLDLGLAQAQSALLHPAVFRFVLLPRSAASPHHPSGRRRPPLAWPATHYISAQGERLSREIETRRANALALHAGLQDLRGVTLPAPEAVAEGVALRLPVLFDDPTAGEDARARLIERGILRGPHDWHDYAGGSPTALSIARRLVTLPTWSGSERAGTAAVALLRERLGAHARD